MSSNTSSDALGAPQVPETSEVLNDAIYDAKELLVEECTSSGEGSDSEDEYIARGEDRTLFRALPSKPKPKNDKSKKQTAAPGGDPSGQAKEPPKTSVPNNDQYCSVAKPRES